MVQRYDLTEYRAADITPVPDSHEGRYVSYEDYAKLELKLRRLAKQVIDRQCDWKTYELAREILDL